jgi:hypothetical protein
MLCTQVMNGISSALKVVPFELGKDFDVVLVSFDPRDTPQAATEKKAAHLKYWSTEITAARRGISSPAPSPRFAARPRPPASATSGTSATSSSPT